ncbi:hypothetical protein AAG570_007800 [Ranatra chinensis]|uniref:Reverse transcriptase domain-containing protein n=1 Tax=Ranatra chinensis TaxID=642074 RepID=A0ABD0XUK8_9HEMI
MDLKVPTGLEQREIIHVAALPERSWDMIMGTNLLRLCGGYVQFRNNKSRMKLGSKSYRVAETEKLEDSLEINVVKVEEDVQEFKKVSESITYKEGEKLIAIDRIKHSIELINSKPVYKKPRWYPVAFREIIRDHIKEMLETGVIRESVSVFNSALWVPKKTDKSGVQKYRVVVEYRELNHRTKTEKYALPRLEEMLNRMSRVQIFSVRALKSGYHQIKMEPEDIGKTSFQFESEKYEFVRMPFRLKNAPITF